MPTREGLYQGMEVGRKREEEEEEGGRGREREGEGGRGREREGEGILWYPVGIPWAIPFTILENYTLSRPQLAMPLIGQFLQAVTRTLLGTWRAPELA